MSKKAIHRVNVSEVIKSSKGKIFHVTFIKKNGELRDMKARLGVKRGVKGTGSPVGPHAPIMRAFDMEKQAFRSISLDTLKTISIAGEQYVVID